MGVGALHWNQSALLVLGLFSLPALAEDLPRQSKIWTQRSATADEKEILARIVKGEIPSFAPLEGQVAVAAVVLNRVRSPHFPNSIARVAHQKWQFSAYNPDQRNKLYYGRIPQYAIQAAELALQGYDPSYGADHYFNPYLVSPGWAKRLVFVRRIGRTETHRLRVTTTHDFYGRGRHPATPMLDGPVIPNTPAPGQVVGRLHLENPLNGVHPDGARGLRLRWETEIPQTAYRVWIKTPAGRSLYDSQTLRSNDKFHDLPLRLQHDREYVWMVGVLDDRGRSYRMQDWVEFRTDFTAPIVEAIEPKGGVVLQTQPVLKWRYHDAEEGTQAAYRVHVSRSQGDEGMLHDSALIHDQETSHTLRFPLEPGKSYYWRTLVYDGRGNFNVTRWERFRTHDDYVPPTAAPEEAPAPAPKPATIVSQTAAPPAETQPAPATLSVTLVSPTGGQEHPKESAVTLRWRTESTEGKPQTRVHVWLVGPGRKVLVDSEYDGEYGKATSFQTAKLPPGTYYWMVAVSDGQEVAYSLGKKWLTFKITEETTGALQAIPQ